MKILHGRGYSFAKEWIKILILFARQKTDTSKRTLQLRGLKHLLDLGLLKVEGATNDRRYFVNL
jgi:hypothetical protein